MNKKESNALSGARSLAIVLVVLGHAIINDIRETNLIVNFLRTIIYSFHMFFFFFISGMLFEKGISKYKNGVRDFVKGKMKLLIVPFITITIIEYVGLFFVKLILGTIGIEVGLGDIRFESFIKAIFLNEGHFDTHLWYVYILFFLFLINILFFRKRISLFVLLGCVLLVFIYPCLALVPWKFQSLVYNIVPFGLGRILYHRHFIQNAIIQKKSRIVVYAILMVMITGVIYYLEQIYTGNLFEIPYIQVGIPQNLRYINGILGSVILIYCGHNLINFPSVEKVLRCLDKYSYEIYLYHQPFITVGCATVLLKLRCPVLINLVISTCVGIIIPVLISKILFRKNPLLRKLFVGDH